MDRDYPTLTLLSFEICLWCSCSYLKVVTVIIKEFSMKDADGFNVVWSKRFFWHLLLIHLTMLQISNKFKSITYSLLNVLARYNLLLTTNFNPRLTKLFFVTRITRGVVTTSSLDFPNRTPYETDFGTNRLVWTFSIHIPKWVQSAKALRSYDVIKIFRTWKLRIFEKKGENSKKNRYESSDYQTFTGFSAYTKGKW